MLSKFAVFLAMPLIVSVSPAPAQGLGDIFKEVLTEYAERKAEEAGIDLTDGHDKNVSWVFSGAASQAPDVFESLHTVATDHSSENDSPAGVGVLPTPGPIVLLPSAINYETQCFNLVQNKIAWNHQGNKRWSAGNIKKLCKGATTASAAPQCFSNAMFNGRSWGKTSAHQMNWVLATQLCTGVTNPTTPISCLKSQLQRRLSLSNAINVCDSDAATKYVRSTPKPKLQEDACYSYVQGRIPWDAAGKNTRWASANVKRLCKGTSSKYSPGNCFSYAMHKGASWGKKSNHIMSWSKAIDLCEGVSNAQKVTACFRSAIGSGSNVDNAVKKCT